MEILLLNVVLLNPFVVIVEMWQASPNQNNIFLGVNNIQWTNTIDLKKDDMFLFPKFVFPYE